MGWRPVGHVLRGSNPRVWHEAASDHLPYVEIPVATLARGCVCRASSTFRLVAGRDLFPSRATRRAHVGGDSRCGGLSSRRVDLAQPLTQSTHVTASRRQDPLERSSTLPRRHSCSVSSS